MTVKAIPFTTEMTRAILAGQKSQTRRVVKVNQLERIPANTHRIESDDGVTWDVYWSENEAGIHASYCRPIKAPYVVGDVLYVKETHRIDYLSDCYNTGRARYKADMKYEDFCYTEGEREMLIRHHQNRWCSSMFMPRALARIFLRVTNITVQRVQEITDEDAKLEGANFKNGKNVGFEEKMSKSPRERFIEIWDRINGGRKGAVYAWDKNPWVWVYTFERIEKPEGTLF